MADWFAHRLDAEEIAKGRISTTGRLYFIRPARGGFLVIETQKPAPKRPLSEITLYEVKKEPVTKKTLIGTIDCTPTWAAILPTLLVLLEDGSAEGQIYARDELKRMAALADLWVERQKTERAA